MLISCLLSRADVRQVPLILFVFFSKNNFVLFAHVSCPSKIVSIVTILCLFFQKKSETQKLKRTKFTYDFGNYFLSLKHFEHFFF